MRLDGSDPELRNKPTDWIPEAVNLAEHIRRSPAAKHSLRQKPRAETTCSGEHFLDVENKKN